MFWWIALIVAVAAVVFFMRQHSGAGRQQALPKEPREPRRVGSTRVVADKAPKDAFQGCMVMPQKDSCQAIQRLRGRTLPADRVIEIPVNGCDRTACMCQLHRVVGRRRNIRRSQADRRIDVRFGTDRRSGRDRRKGDNTWGIGT